MLSLVVSIGLLAGVLAVAISKPHRPPESVVAVAAAAVVLGTGIVGWSDARDEVSRLAPVVVFLAAVLLLGACCAAEGVFETVGRWLARSSGGPSRLLVWVFVVAAAVTCVLSLDATVVLLTPVVLSAANRLGVSPAPAVYATGHVANSGSLLLPTGNLTNLLALSAAGLSLLHFALLMLVPWILVLTVEYVVLRVYFRHELAAPPGDRAQARAQAGPVGSPASSADPPRFAFAVLGLTLAGFVLTSVVGVEAYWAAIAGAVVLAAHSLRRHVMSPARLVAAVDAPFLLFVLGLAVVVRAAVENGLGDAAERTLPASTSLLALLAMAGIGAVLANLVNNLPALLILLPVAAGVGSTAVLAVLIGVNIGPNLTYPGSLATLLWRRVLRDHGLVPSLRRFTVLGVLTVPLCLSVGVVGLWLVGEVVGAA